MSLKRSTMIFLALALLLGLSLFLILGKPFHWKTEITFAQTDDVRPPYVSGTFYPSSPPQLKEIIRSLLDAEPSQNLSGPIFALIAPHAGYAYSASTAAKAYAQLKGHKYKRVVVIAPSHHDSFPYASVYNGKAYTTPLGSIPIDKEFSKALAKSNPLIKLSSSGHSCASAPCEHAVEVELPFLQQALGDFKLVPIVIGAKDYEIERAIGVALAQLIKTEEALQVPDTLIVASSDLSHYHDNNEAQALDALVLQSIKDGDFFSLSINIENRVWEACGGGPIVATMIAAERLGANERVILGHLNSGDITGDTSRVVGYGSVAFLRNDREQSLEDASTGPLTLEDKKELLAIAKTSVEAAVLGKKPPESSSPLTPSLLAARGAFVTLKENGHLRGCIGSITPSQPLADTVREVAVYAATKDRRFSPVQPEELDLLHYEVSVLSPLRRVAKIKNIRIGQDGLLIRKGQKQGVLLPQVPQEQGWDSPEYFASQTALKAGLPPDAWKDEKTDLFSFSAEVFGLPE